MSLKVGGPFGLGGEAHMAFLVDPIHRKSIPFLLALLTVMAATFVEPVHRGNAHRKIEASARTVDVERRQARNGLNV